MIRVGFVINSRVPSVSAILRGMPPHRLLTGWNDAGSPMGFMRFGWVADSLRRAALADYALYRPGARFDAVIMLKSMGDETRVLSDHLRARGTSVIFEANVDYYSRPGIEVPMEAMAPTPKQRADAIGATASASGVIASSAHLASICAQFNRRVIAVADNVNPDLVPDHTRQAPIRDGRLQIWWSGMSSKLFELLAARSAFLAMKERIHLHLVTGSLDEMNRWDENTREKMQRFLAAVPHTIHPFTSIPGLLDLYSRGGVIVSPRFLDAPYNLSHTEWKLTLGMACGLPAIASPVPSYVAAAALAGHEDALTICRTESDWLAGIEKWLVNPGLIRSAGRGAEDMVRDHYSTPVIAREHLAAVRQMLDPAKP